MTKKIRIVGGTYSGDTKVFIDDIEQKMLTDVKVILEVGEPNRIILEYHDVEVDTAFEGVVISTPEGDIGKSLETIAIELQLIRERLQTMGI